MRAVASLVMCLSSKVVFSLFLWFAGVCVASNGTVTLHSSAYTASSELRTDGAPLDSENGTQDPYATLQESANIIQDLMNYQQNDSIPAQDPAQDPAQVVRDSEFLHQDEISQQDPMGELQDVVNRTQNFDDLSQDSDNSIIFTDKPLPVPRIEVSVTKCRGDTNITEYFSEVGELRGWLNQTLQGGESLLCYWKISVPEDLYLAAVVELLLDPCDSDINLAVADYPFSDTSHTVLANLHCGYRSQVLLAPTYLVYLKLTTSRLADTFNRERNLLFKVRFQGTRSSLRYKLTTVFTTPTSGYITTPGFGGRRGAPFNINATYHLSLPRDHVVMVSYPLFDIPNHIIVDTVEYVTWINRVFTWYVAPVVYPRIYDSSLVIRYVSESSDTFYRGFKMLFSFHPTPQAPQVVSRIYFSSVFNCSVPHYPSFKQHLECNLRVDCQGGEDEGEHCPFSPPGCNGLPGYKNKCYSLVGYGRHESDRYFLYPDQASEHCQRLGGRLATMKTRGEWEAFLDIFVFGGFRESNTLVGLKRFQTPEFYRNTVRWIDGTVSYDTNFTYSSTQDAEDAWMYFHAEGHFEVGKLKRRYKGAPLRTPYVCETEVNMNVTASQHKVQIRELEITKTLSSFRRANVSLVECPDGHVTHDFLSCDLDSDCGTNVPSDQCYLGNIQPEESGVALVVDTERGDTSDAKRGTAVSVSMFVCDDNENTIHFTLVCDFREDCEDGSDEAFCVHGETCDGFTCNNGQCVSANKRCDSMWNCLDGSDEGGCERFATSRVYRLPPPALVDFVYGGNIEQVKYDRSSPCPETHFRCPGESDYCLPVYVRCNGVYDCPGHEDEMDCERYVCPGFYRCRAFDVCVHPDHLCDGWPQCPQRDDESLCGATCPESCRCQGLAFICPRPFPASSFKNLRYLDGAGSGMTPSDLTDYVYLIWLSLASCQLSSIGNIKLPNMKTLDLSFNKLVFVSMASFQFLTNLRSAILAGNPMTTVVGDSLDFKQNNLRFVDLSNTLIEELDSGAFSNFMQIQTLNVSFSKLNTLAASGFFYTPELRTLDMRGNPVRQYPGDLFKPLKDLKVVHADNYELCCKALLPEAFDERFCFAPEDEISSCEDLLRSDIYRVFLWAIALSSVAGNATSFFFRLLIQKSSLKSAFSVFVTNLCLADLLMGVYLFIIGAADLLYIDNYILSKTFWTDSPFCKAAGFLSLLSSEVSALLICLITLDRFIVLRFPFGTFRFKRRSSILACVAAWSIGLVLAGVPLLPVTSHWKFYSQTGICIPLPITRKAFGGRDYSFGVMIVFNFVLFLLIAAGQAIIFWSVRRNTLSVETTRKSQDLTIARRLITVAVSDFLCWFPIGLLGLMAGAGVPVPSDFNVVTAIFVLPLNSALNPFLYTYNLLVEKRRKVREGRLLKLLESQLTLEDSSVS